MTYEDIQKFTKEKKELEQIAAKIAARLEQAPDGTLNSSLKNNVPIYYHVIKTPDSIRRKYIKKENLNLIKQLTQKQYDTDILKLLQKHLRAIDRFIRQYHPEKLKEIYSNISKDRRILITAEFVDDDTYVKQWLSVTYAPGNFENTVSEYYTAKGERVRSKTEKIIADTLFYAGIPYRYEYPIRLKDGIVLRPDFIVLNKRTRKEYILEHLGMMDNPEYCNMALGKLSVYLQNHIFPGEQLLLTFDSSTRPFSTKDLTEIIDHYFL